MERDEEAPTALVTNTDLDQLECVDPEIGEMLPFFAEGRLASADRSLVVAHLRACLRCEEDERVMREVALGIASLRARPDPAAALSPDRAPQRRSFAIVVIAAAALAVLVLVSWSRGLTPVDRTPEMHALEARVQHLEAQNTQLSRTIAQERARWESSPLTGIPIAAPPNL